MELPSLRVMPSLLENVCTEAACAASRVAFVPIMIETHVRVATHKSCHFLQGSQQFVISLNCNYKTKPSNLPRWCKRCPVSEKIYATIFTYIVTMQ